MPLIKSTDEQNIKKIENFQGDFWEQLNAKNSSNILHSSELLYSNIKPISPSKDVDDSQSIKTSESLIPIFNQSLNDKNILELNSKINGKNIKILK